MAAGLGTSDEITARLRAQADAAARTAAGRRRGHERARSDDVGTPRRHEQRRHTLALENPAGRTATPGIEVRTELAGDRVRLAVSDNGGGFPEELMARIFEPYVTTKPKGMGLGLYICRRIVQAHGGRIWIESEPGVGSTFFFTLPR